MPVEAAIGAVALLGLLMLVMLAARVAQARADVASAASAAARAASLTGTPGAAASAADVTAIANLGGEPCASPAVATNAAGLDPGGSVTVEVTCTVALSDLALIALPSDVTFTAQATAVVDDFRGIGP